MSESSPEVILIKTILLAAFCFITVCWSLGNGPLGLSQAMLSGTTACCSVRAAPCRPPWPPTTLWQLLTPPLSPGPVFHLTGVLTIKAALPQTSVKLQIADIYSSSVRYRGAWLCCLCLPQRLTIGEKISGIGPMLFHFPPPLRPAAESVLSCLLPPSLRLLFLEVLLCSLVPLNSLSICQICLYLSDPSTQTYNFSLGSL